MGERRGQRVDPAVGIAVWEAEDGRCESCKRPMDRRWARFTRVDHTRADWSADNLHLLCVDCDRRRPDLLTTVVLGEPVAQRVMGHLGPQQAEQATCWLLGNLKRSAVVLRATNASRFYWLPGVGVFQVVPQPDGTAAVMGVDKLAPVPQVRVKPQARTRGLPRPDRRPLPAPAPRQERGRSPQNGAPHRPSRPTPGAPALRGA